MWATVQKEFDILALEAALFKKKLLFLFDSASKPGLTCGFCINTFDINMENASPKY